MSMRKKARLNVKVAKDLADSFGGSKSEYLKRLNRNLKVKRSAVSGFNSRHFSKDA